MDSYFPSYFTDLSKLLTEIIGCWSYVNSNKIINESSRLLLYDLLNNNKFYEIFEPHYKQLVILDLLRTLPYIEDVSKKNNIKNIIKNIYQL